MICSDVCAVMRVIHCADNYPTVYEYWLYSVVAYTFMCVWFSTDSLRAEGNNHTWQYAACIHRQFVNQYFSHTVVFFCLYFQVLFL